MRGSDDEARLSYLDRLRTFDDYWTTSLVTARQLAAIGHVSDRPPLESLLEGSRCITCSHFVPKTLSIITLQGSVNPKQFKTLVVPDFHRAGCQRLQVRVPFDTPRWYLDTAHPSASLESRLGTFESVKKNTEAEAEAELMTVASSSTSFLSLPLEIRLQIYEYVLPPLAHVTEIVQIDRDSMRVTTAQALHCPRPPPHDSAQSCILRVCRTMHREVLDLIFSHTSFTFASSKLLYMFLRRIGVLGRALVRNVDVRCGQREDAMTFALLASCDALRSLTLRLPRARLVPPCAPIWIQDGVACLLSIAGLEEVKFGSCDEQNSLSEEMLDAKIVVAELTRLRDAASAIRTVDGMLDI